MRPGWSTRRISLGDRQQELCAYFSKIEEKIKNRNFGNILRPDPNGGTVDEWSSLK